MKTKNTKTDELFTDRDKVLEEDKAVELSKVPDYLKDEAKDTMESLGLSQSDVVFNHILLVQALSPQLRDRAFEGLKQGDIINTNGTNYGSTFRFIVLKIWTDRFYKDKATGAVCFSADGKTGGTISPKCIECPNSQFGSAKNGRGVLCPERRSYLILPVDSNNNIMDDPAIMRLKSTKARVAKKINSLILTSSVPMVGRVFKISVVEEEVDKQPFFNFTVESAGYASKTSFAVAKELSELVKNAHKEVIADPDDEIPAVQPELHHIANARYDADVDEDGEIVF